MKGSSPVPELPPGPATLAIADDATFVDTPRWNVPTRIAFRFAFCYFVLYALCCGNATLWEVIPFHIGEHIENWLVWPFKHGAQWLVQHHSHIHGIGAKLHDTGSGDTVIDWTAAGLMLSLAITAALLWTLLDRRSLAYPRLFGWFRFILRLTLAVAMMGYGFAKLYPFQMAPPSLAVLNEPFGNLSPMTLLWTMIGLNPLYEMICGAVEVVSGLLILFRRTALLGALLTAFVVSNVVLYNFFFDVPVKLYASHLLLMAIVLVIPDLRPLFQFFWQHRPAAPTLPWSPWPLGSTGKKRFIEPAILALVLFSGAILPLVQGWGQYKHMRANINKPADITGQWHVDSATFAGQPKPFLTGDGLPLTDLYFEPSGRVMARAADNALWRGGADINDKKKTFTLYVQAHGDDGVNYSFTKPDSTHLILTPIKDSAKTESTLNLSRVPLPQHYPLLDRGFHLVNEWGLER